MYREDINVEQIIKSEISKVVDQWVNDLVRNKIAAPMPQQYQRGLWDRVKGTLSNLWYAGRGGRNNQNNPYYWKNRFGDELGSQTESYNPRVFTLYEFKEIKKVIDEAEDIVEEIQPDLEKLQIVKMIRSAAEDLKKKLFNLFSQTCSSQEPAQVRAGADTTANNNSNAQVKADPVQQDDERTKNAAGMDQSPRERAQAAAELGPGSEEELDDLDDSDPKELILSDKEYEEYKPNPKRNKDRSIRDLWGGRHLVDLVLHKDFKEGEKKFLEKMDDRIKALRNDALIKKEDQDTMEMINAALDKLERITNELG
jgi:hypothetical protein